MSKPANLRSMWSHNRKLSSAILVFLVCFIALVSITLAAPPGGITLTLTPNSISTEAGGSVDLSGSFTDADGGQNYLLVINWGDGSANQNVPISTATSFGPINHVYPSGMPLGTVYVSVTVIDSGFEYDSGSTTLNIVNAPTAIGLGTFKAKLTRANNARLRWGTGSELNLMGFNVYRQTVGALQWHQLNTAPIPAKNIGTVNGASYQFTDKRVISGKTYRYKLEILYASGESGWSEPVKIRVP